MKEDLIGKDTGKLRARARQHEEDGDSAGLDAAPLLVLLAEDDAAMRDALGVQLRADGFRVKEVGDGEALRRYLERALRGSSTEPMPDLVISDIQMPGPDGLEVLQWLRAHDWTIPVILVTAFGDDATHAEATRLGVSAVLDKPFDIDLLRATIDRVVLR